MDERLTSLESLQCECRVMFSGTSTGHELAESFSAVSRSLSGKLPHRARGDLLRSKRLLTEVLADLHLELILCQTVLGELPTVRLYDSAGQTTWSRAA